MTNRKRSSQKFDANRAKARAEKMPGHFFASSVAEWRTGADPEAIIQAMQSGGFAFALWWVPVAADAPYSIEHYAPKVEGAVMVGSWGFEQLAGI